MAAHNLNHRVIPFPTRSVPKTTNPNEKLLKAAKLAERAITLALGCNVANRNTVVLLLRAAIEEAEQSPPPSGPATAQANPRCEEMRSHGYDPTGEHAIECGAPADLECEECGFLCWGCADEHTAHYANHHLIEIAAMECAA